MNDQTTASLIETAELSLSDHTTAHDRHVAHSAATVRQLELRPGLRTASVVINTYNRAPYLRNAIRSIAYQSYPALELVVVNGPSTDGTEAILEECRKAGLTFKIARCANRNLSESRNIGIAEASGDVVFFIDDDAVAHPDWIARLMTCYEDPSVGAAGGFTIDHTGVTYQCRYTVCDRFGNATFFNLIDPTSILERLGNFNFPSLLGTNCSFRREDLLDIGGFDEAYAYFLDETDVCLRLRDKARRIVTAPRALVFHKYAPSDLRSVEKIPTSLFAPAKSKAHFVIKHSAQNPGGVSPALVGNAELDHYANEIQFSNRWYLDHKKISTEHYLRLDNDLRRGISEGVRSGLDLALSADGAPASKPDLDRGRAFQGLTGNARAKQVRERLKIYFVSQGYPPKDTSGIARWTHECAQSLTSRGHEVHVLTRSSTGNHFVDYADGIWVHALTDESPEGPLLPSPVDIPDSLARRAAAVYAEVRRAEDIWGVSVVSAPIWDLEGLYCVKYLDKPVVTSLHTTYQLALPSKPDWQARPDYRQNHVDRVIQGERWLLDHSANILANSQEVVREIDSAYALTLGADRSRVTMVPHGIAASPGDAEGRASQAAGGPSDSVSVLFVGRVEARKGVDQLLQALLRLRSDVTKVNVDIVGAWPSQTDSYAQKVKALAKEIQAKRRNVALNFVGYVSDDELLRCYQSADIFVAPSRFESFGLIVIEAMRSGCPVIASDIGGIREIVDETTGLLAGVDDHETLARQLEKLICSGDLRKSMGEAGRRKFGALYTAERMAARLEHYYHEILKRS